MTAGYSYQGSGVGAIEAKDGDGGLDVLGGSSGSGVGSDGRDTGSNEARRGSRRTNCAGSRSREHGELSGGSVRLMGVGRGGVEAGREGCC